MELSQSILGSTKSFSFSSLIFYLLFNLCFEQFLNKFNGSDLEMRLHMLTTQPVLALPVLVSVSQATYVLMYVSTYIWYLCTIVAIRSPLGNCSSPCDSLSTNKGGAFDLLSVLSIASLCFISFYFISFHFVSSRFV